MRELALQSANGSNSDADRGALQKEVTALKDELSRIADTTSFGGQQLLDGSYGTKTFQVGANANETIAMSLGNIGADQIGARQLDLNAADSAADGGLGQSVGDASLTVPVGNKVAGNLDINGLTPVQITTSTDDSAKDVAQKNK
jgi:flagellin